MQYIDITIILILLRKMDIFINYEVAWVWFIVRKGPKMTAFQGMMFHLFTTLSSSHDQRSRQTIIINVPNFDNCWLGGSAKWVPEGTLGNQ